MPALFFFNVALFAKIARPRAKAESLPCAPKKNVPLKVGNYRLHICIRITVYQYCPSVSVQDLAHLFG
jgi:hypothetical protein